MTTLSSNAPPFTRGEETYRASPSLNVRCSAGLLAGMLAALSLGGCGLATTRIDAEDSRVFLPAARATLDLSEGKQPPSQAQTGHAVEIGIAGARGSDSQSLPAGQAPIILNDTVFLPPQDLKNEFAFSFADVSWRWRRFSGEGSLGLEVLAGLGYSSLGLTVSSPAQRASDHFATWGPQAGLGLIWRMRPTTSLQARAVGFLSGATLGVNETFRLELSVSQAFHENLSLRVGYAVWEVKGQEQASMSDFQLRFSGPMLALDISGR